MKDFIFKDLSSNIEEELKNVGYDKSYIFEGAKKFYYKTLKIFDLTLPQANILKQTALSVGADCATHRETITGKTDKTDCVLGGSISQLKKISAKLKFQPFNLKILGEQIENNILLNLKPIEIKNKMFDFSRPYIVGILNLGNSFSDGYTNFEDAKSHLKKLINDGADIIDIGAESTKPGASAVDDNEQLKKLIPIVDFAKTQNLPISIDTRSAKVAKICLEHGADIINDVSGFDYDLKMVDVISEFNCPVIVQHTSATPDIMQQKTEYNNLVDDIFKSLYKKIELAKSHGVNGDKIILDVGIGFGKTREQCLSLLRRIEEFKTLNCPLMVGISRKSFLNLQTEDNFTKDIFTLALNSNLIDKGVNFLRVHNVELHKKLLGIKVLEH
ncbi:dihydropteroate synthase [bacterium]|nr:dihydropteroate synthase [bacterium]